jgi:hypothetical protein
VAETATPVVVLVGNIVFFHFTFHDHGSLLLFSSCGVARLQDTTTPTTPIQSVSSFLCEWLVPLNHPLVD